MYHHQNSSPIKFIAVDWGASNFRAYVIDETGEIRQRTKAHQGVSRIRDHNYAATLKRLLGKWFNKYPRTPILMSGMIGGHHGWQEVEYAETPINITELATTVEKIFNHRFDREIYIVPGVKIYRAGGSMDAMRGEEVQAFGALTQLPAQERHYICCPGRYSKWLEIHNHSICNIQTFVTGELFNLLTKNSILAPYADGAYMDPQYFQQGLKVCQQNEALLANLYSIYIEELVEYVPPTKLPSYLSALLIGNEIQSAKKMLPKLETLTLVGTPWLMDIYQQAANFFAIKTHLIRNDVATAAGLNQIFDCMSQVRTSHAVAY